ncbi:hypothetical protein ACTFIW_003887 [Dictyostelium discoideum]
MEFKKQRIEELTIEEIDQLLLEKEESIRRAEEELKDTFLALRITPDQLHEFINDRSNFTYEAWELIERERLRNQYLEKISPGDISPTMTGRTKNSSVRLRHSSSIRRVSSFASSTEACAEFTHLEKASPITISDVGLTTKGSSSSPAGHPFLQVDDASQPHTP